MTVLDLAGFADPVAEAQQCFRAVLDAMARPGSLRIAGAGLRPPGPLDPATAAVLLTLIDGETSLWLDPDAAPARKWVEFHCGVTCVEDAGAAAFVAALAWPDLGRLNPGSDAAPEAAATVILQVLALGTGARYRLRGPGLLVPMMLAVAGLPSRFADIWERNAASFPHGIDLVLCAGTQIAALRRTVSIEDA